MLSEHHQLYNKRGGLSPPPPPTRDDWQLDIRLILDALAYSYENLAAAYIQQMSEIQAEFRQVTALAEVDLRALMEQARHDEVDQATGNPPAGIPGEGGSGHTA